MDVQVPEVEGWERDTLKDLGKFEVEAMTASDAKASLNKMQPSTIMKILHTSIIPTQKNRVDTIMQESTEYSSATLW